MVSKRNVSYDTAPESNLKLLTI